MTLRSMEAILAQYETKSLKARLLEFPPLIREAKLKVAQARQGQKDCEQSRLETESELIVEIAAEVNPNTGKPVFSNAENRAAELARRRMTDPAWQEIAKACREAEWEVNEAQGNLEMLQDQFKAYRYIVDLTARELALLAAGANEDQECAAKEPF